MRRGRPAYRHGLLVRHPVLHMERGAADGQFGGGDMIWR
jgi:hypothetical protein